jgi:hypothetical protein
MHCDGCGFIEPDDLSKSKRKIGTVTLSEGPEPRWAGDQQEVFKADLCVNCRALMLHTYFKIPMDEKLELAVPTFVVPEPIGEIGWDAYIFDGCGFAANMFWPLTVGVILRYSIGRSSMPVQKSKGGYKYGKGGKVYRGKGAKAKAAKQGRAIAISKARSKGHRIPKKKWQAKRIRK